jgi:tritrans,polycis-undecaprenyl-diphosphate synthase [geranylgeranyl-diphosphate specific]
MPSQKPKHIAIILDGNRRFAKKLMLEPWKGHEYGKEKVSKLLEWCRAEGVKELTLYAFSLQNFNRPKEEFEYLMKLFRQGYEEFFEDQRIMDNKICIKVIGRYHLLPSDIVQKIEKIMDKTKDNNEFFLNIALAYGGREEITDAVKRLLVDFSNQEFKIDKIDESLVKRYLDLESEPDIIIRTGGEKRTSNFLPWQSIYSEWFFLDKTWPEFEREDLIQILQEYSDRDRRFGK